MKMFIYNPNLSYCSILTLSQYPPMHTTAISVRVVWNEIFRSCQSLIISILPALTWGKECFAYQSSLHQNGFENVSSRETHYRYNEKPSHYSNPSWKARRNLITVVIVVNVFLVLIALLHMCNTDLSCYTINQQNYNTKFAEALSWH